MSAIRPLPVDPNRGAELYARAVFEPQGLQLLEIDRRGGMPIFLTRDQVEWVEAAITEFKREALFEEGRPSERTHRHVVPLMTRAGNGEAR